MLTLEALYGNGAISEVRPPNEDVDHNRVAILALLLAVTQHLGHLVLILP